MRTFKIKISAGLIVMVLVSACVGDLDVTPLNPTVTTAANVYKTTNDYKKGLAKLYATYAVSGQRGPEGLPDISGIREDFGNYLRQYWNAQQLSTDESIMAWADATIK